MSVKVTVLSNMAYGTVSLKKQQQKSQTGKFRRKGRH